ALGPVRHLDNVITILGFDGSDDVTDAGSHRGSLEWSHHRAAAEIAEIAAPGCTARIVRQFPGHCGKVLAGLNALPGLLRPLTGCGTGFGVTFRCADENVLRADGDILRGTDV